jgi:exopolysaccharide biosynthesis protein
VNGDFFSYGSYKPSGLAMSDGKRWPGTQPGGWHGTLFMNGRHVQVARRGDHVPKWAEDAISGRPAVLAGGRVITDYSAEPDKARPSRRTGVGLSRDGRGMYIVAVESPISAKDLGRLMKRYGAHDGMSFDSGGSAQLYVRGRGLVQQSSDPGGRRAVANSLLIHAG